MNRTQTTYRSYAKAVSEGNTEMSYNEYFGDTEDSKYATDATEDTELVKYVEDIKMRIKKGFKVTKFTADGFDKSCGRKDYYVTCVNGFEDREWELGGAIESSIQSALNTIHRDGFNTRKYTKTSLEKVFFPEIYGRKLEEHSHPATVYYTGCTCCCCQRIC